MRLKSAFCCSCSCSCSCLSYCSCSGFWFSSCSFSFSSGSSNKLSKFFLTNCCNNIFYFFPLVFALALGVTKVFYMPTDSWYLHARSINVAPTPLYRTPVPISFHTIYIYTYVCMHMWDSRCLFVWVCGKTFLTCKYKTQSDGHEGKREGEGEAGTRRSCICLPPSREIPMLSATLSYFFIRTKLSTFCIAYFSGCVREKSRDELLSCFNAFGAYNRGTACGGWGVGWGWG